MYKITVRKTKEIDGEMWQTTPTSVEVTGTVRTEGTTGNAYHKIRIYVDDILVFEDKGENYGTAAVAEQRAKKWLDENTDYNFMQRCSEISKEINFTCRIKEVTRKKDMI